MIPYRTVLACNSIGAPDSTAAGRIAWSSLPSITRFGTGVNVLENAFVSINPNPDIISSATSKGYVRGGLVDVDAVVGGIR